MNQEQCRKAVIYVRGVKPSDLPPTPLRRHEESMIGTDFDLALWLGMLANDLENGPDGARMRSGALEEDLAWLKAKLQEAK